MNFLYQYYSRIIKTLVEHNYSCCNYNNNVPTKHYILRHDVDFSLEKAAEFAKFEADLGVSSTYFILLRTDFYNIFSKRSHEFIRSILDSGHEIGLHFDETFYAINNDKTYFENCVLNEVQILSQMIGIDIKAASMHRPSRFALENDFDFGDVINSYSKKFFSEYKYVSDSRMHWREDIIQLIKSQDYPHIQILTHPIWYSDNIETLEEKLQIFYQQAPIERWNFLRENFTNLEDVLKLPKDKQ